MNTICLTSAEGMQLDLEGTESASRIRCEMPPLLQDTTVTWVIATIDESPQATVRFCLGDGGLFLVKTEAGVWTVSRQRKTWTLEYLMTSQ